MKEIEDKVNKNVSSIEVLKEQARENSKEHGEIKKGIAEVKVELVDLKMNHVIFKTKTMVYFGIGVAILSSIGQLLFNYISKLIWNGYYFSQFGVGSVLFSERILTWFLERLSEVLDIIGGKSDWI